MASFTAAPANWTNSSDANFRSWGSYIAGRFAAVGLVQTADTGQINWTTVTAPLAVTTYQGYEIWRFADALQATAPVYFKIEYGSTNTSANNPGIRIVFGTGSDGVGNLTGTLSSATLYTAGVTASAGAGTIFGSGSTNRFVFLFFTGANPGMYWGFERTLDASGNVTNEGVWMFSKPNANTGTLTIQFWNRSTGVVGPTPGANTYAAMFPDTTGITGLQTIVSPIFPEKGVFGNPILNICGYLTTDIATSSIATVYAYGVAHTYYFSVAANSGQATNFRGPSPGSAGESLAFRYE